MWKVGFVVVMEKIGICEELKFCLKDYIDLFVVFFVDVFEFRKWLFYWVIIMEFIFILFFFYIVIGIVVGVSWNVDCVGVGILGIVWVFGGMIFVFVYCIVGILGVLFLLVELL